MDKAALRVGCNPRGVDMIRLGLSLRALRRRRGWTQFELAVSARSSQSAISRVERGVMRRVPVGTIEDIAHALGARVDLRVLWQGEGLDRLLDERHAALVDAIVRQLGSAGWAAEPEVTFAIGRERGSIDVFARHHASGGLLVVEVKSVVPDLQALLAGIGRKARVAALIARQRGWPAGAVSRMLVLPDERTCRRRLERHPARSRLPCRSEPWP